MPYGEFPYSVDDKGRVIIPPLFREFVKNGMVITRGLEQCLYIFPSRKWEELEEELKTTTITDAASRGFMRYFYSGAAEVKCDGIFRITLPSTLRAFAGLGSSVTIAGTPNHLEVWDSELWNATIASLQVSPPMPERLSGMVG